MDENSLMCSTPDLFFTLTFYRQIITHLALGPPVGLRVVEPPSKPD
jgi:hypothetical protein